MSGSEKQFFFEPVKYVAKTETRERRARTIPDEVPLHLLRREVGGQYFFSKVIRENKDAFEVVDMMSQLDSTLKESIMRINDELKERFSKIVPSTEMIEKVLPSKEQHRIARFIDYDMPSRYYFYKEGASVIWRTGSDSFYVVSKTKENAEKVIGMIKSEFERLNIITKDFGLELVSFLTGPDYQKALLQTYQDVQTITYREPKNEFEKGVIDFCSNFTTSFLHNIEICFTEPIETCELDIFIGFSEQVKLVIEPTNYENLKEQMPPTETLKSKIILGTHDKAQRIGAKVIVIAGGFPDEIFKELKKIADSRHVTLLSDVNYKSELPLIFWDNLLEAYLLWRRTLERYYIHSLP
jgi:hypothetical protein